MSTKQSKSRRSILPKNIPMPDFADHAKIDGINEINRAAAAAMDSINYRMDRLEMMETKMQQAADVLIEALRSLSPSNTAEKFTREAIRPRNLQNSTPLRTGDDVSTESLHPLGYYVRRKDDLVEPGWQVRDPDLEIAAEFPMNRESDAHYFCMWKNAELLKAGKLR